MLPEYAAYLETQFAELGDHILGPELQPSRTARMPPGRGGALRHLQRGGGGAQLVQHGVEVGLHLEQVVRLDPVPLNHPCRTRQPGGGLPAGSSGNGKPGSPPG